MLNNYLIPFIVLIIIIYGFFKKIDIYEVFIEGAKDGLVTVLHILPNMLALILAVNVFVESDILGMVGGRVKDILALCFLRPISGNASLAMLNNIYSKYGVDSFFSFLGSVIQGSTDTTIYVLALYFGSVGIKKSRYALKVGLFADLCGILAAFIVSYLFF